jgi:hypothetical protein
MPLSILKNLALEDKWDLFHPFQTKENNPSEVNALYLWRQLNYKDHFFRNDLSNLHC